MALSAASETVAILVELELESPIHHVSWRELVSDAFDERESDAELSQQFLPSTSLSSIFSEMHSGYRGDEARYVLDSEPSVANEIKVQMGLPMDYYTRVPADPMVEEVCELLTGFACSTAVKLQETTSKTRLRQPRGPVEL